MSRPYRAALPTVDPFDDILRAVPKGSALLYSPATRTATVLPIPESVREREEVSRG